MAVLKTLFRDRFLMSEKRMQICRKCEHYDRKWDRCNECGCFMGGKTLMVGQECPLGKWGPEMESLEENKEI